MESSQSLSHSLKANQKQEISSSLNKKSSSESNPSSFKSNQSLSKSITNPLKSNESVSEYIKIEDSNIIDSEESKKFESSSLSQSNPITSEESEVYESQFESYHDSSSLKVIKPNTFEETSKSSEKIDKQKFSLPIKSITDPEARFSQHQSSELSESVPEEIAENINSDFDTERSEKKLALSSNSSNLKNSNYRSTLANFETKFPHPAESVSSSLSSPHKISARSHRKSPDLRSSTSSMSEDLEVYDSFSKQSANLENSIRKSASLTDNSKLKPGDSLSESVYSEDFDSESKSFKPTHSYSSDFESISQSDTKNLKGLQGSIKEVSPEESNSDHISESLHETENDYSADFESESLSKKLKSARSEGKEAESLEKKKNLEKIPEEGKSYDAENALADEVFLYIFDILKDDAFSLLSDRVDVDDFVDEIWSQILEDGLRLVPSKLIYVNNPDFLQRELKIVLKNLPEVADVPLLEKVLESYRTGSPVKLNKCKDLGEFVPQTSFENKKPFKSFNKAIKDSINELFTSCEPSLFRPVKPVTKEIIEKKMDKLIHRKMGLIKPCVTQEERKNLEAQRQAVIKEAIDDEIEEGNSKWMSFENFEINFAWECEKQIMNLLIHETQEIIE